MRSVVAAAPELERATEASLQANTDALSQLVASAYGGAPADRFTPLWQRHLGDLLAYAKAVAGNDTSAKPTTRTLLLADADAYAYGSWLAEASKGRVQADDAAAGVRMHVTELMEQADAYAARDYAQAYRIERAAYEHMFTAGAALGKASLTPEVAVGLDAPPEKLRSAFAMLLGEHMELRCRRRSACPRPSRSPQTSVWAPRAAQRRRAAGSRRVCQRGRAAGETRA